MEFENKYGRVCLRIWGLFLCAHARACVCVLYLALNLHCVESLYVWKVNLALSSWISVEA